MINGILTVILYIVLNFVFMQFWGIQGLALATSISITLSSILLSVLSHIYFKEIWTLILKHNDNKYFSIPYIRALSIKEIIKIRILLNGFICLSSILLYAINAFARA